MDTNIKRIKYKPTALVLGIIAIIAAVLYDVFAFVFSSQIQFFRSDVGQITNLVLVIVCNLLAIIGIVGIIVWAKGKKRLKEDEAKTPLKRDESIEEENVAPVAYTRLFVEEFGDEEEEIVVEEEKEEEEEEISFVIQEETDGYHKDGWTFADMHKEFIAFAAEYGVLLDAAQARTLLSAMNVSRLVVLKFDKDANSSLFLKMISAFFNFQYYADNTKKYVSSDDMFFFETKDGYDATGFLYALDEAANDHFAMKVAHLTSVKLSALGSYFTQLMRYVVKPETPYTISFKDKTITDQTFTTTSNLWIFLTLAGDEMVENLPAYVAETAAFVKVKFVEQEGATEKSQRSSVSAAQFLKFGDKARNNFELDENKWKYVDKLEEYVKARADYRLSNKMWQKMERYASCYLALGGEPAPALDSVVAVKMLTTILNLIKHNKKDGDEKFFNVISNIFGEEEVDACRMVIDASAVDAEEGWVAEETPDEDEIAEEPAATPVAPVVQPVEESVVIAQPAVEEEQPVEEPTVEEPVAVEEPVVIEQPVETAVIADETTAPVAETEEFVAVPIAKEEPPVVKTTIAERAQAFAQPIAKAVESVAEETQSAAKDLLDDIADFEVDFSDLDL